MMKRMSMFLLYKMNMSKLHKINIIYHKKKSFKLIVVQKKKVILKNNMFIMLMIK